MKKSFFIPKKKMSIPFDNELFVREIKRYERELYELKDCSWTLDERKEMIAGLKNKDTNVFKDKDMSVLRRGDYIDEDLAVIRWIIALIDNNFDVKQTTFAVLKEKDFEAVKWRNIRPWNTIRYDFTITTPECMFQMLERYEKENGVCNERTIFYCRLLASRAEKKDEIEVADIYHSFANNLVREIFDEEYVEVMNLSVECWKRSYLSLLNYVQSLHKNFIERTIDVLKPNVSHLYSPDEFVITKQTMFGGMTINLDKYFSNRYKGSIDILVHLKEKCSNQDYRNVMKTLCEKCQLITNKTLLTVQTLVTKLIIRYDNGQARYEWRE